MLSEDEDEEREGNEKVEEKVAELEESRIYLYFGGGVIPNSMRMTWWWLSKRYIHFGR